MAFFNTLVFVVVLALPVVAAVDIIRGQGSRWGFWLVLVLLLPLLGAFLWIYQAKGFFFRRRILLGAVTLVGAGMSLWLSWPRSSTSLIDRFVGT